jgi:AhpC/TSA family
MRATHYHQQFSVATGVMSFVLLLTLMSAQALTVGDKAPDFLAFSTVGETVRLSDYQGKKNVMLFFFVRAFGGV